MADPVTMMLVASAVSAVGAYSKGQAEKNAANYNAAVGEVNKGMALRDQSRAFQQAQGRAVAGYGSSGVQLGTGSPLDVLADSAAQSEMDRLKIRFNYDSRINLDRATAKNASTASVLNAASAGLGGYANMRGMGTRIPGTGGGTTSGPMLPQEDFGPWLS